MTASYKVGLMGPDPMIARNAPHRRPPEAATVLKGMLAPLDDALVAVLKASAELGEVNRELVALERGERAATAKDAQAYAAAKRGGDKDPGAANVEEYRRQLADAQRRQAGTRVLIAELARTVERLVDVHGHELAAKLLAARAGFLAEQQEHETAAAAAVQSVKRLESTLHWLQGQAATHDDDDGEAA